MSHFAIGRFESGRSRSPYQFVCKRPYPQGPFALLDTKRLRIARPQEGPYLYELEDWHSIDQRSQFVTKIIAPLHEVRRVLHEALKGAEWEAMTIERRRLKIQIVGGILKTEYGYFEPEYHSGINAFGPGRDVEPWITFEPCPASPENPYGHAWQETPEEIRAKYLCCMDEEEIKRAHDAGIAKTGLGELLRGHYGF